MCYGLEQGTPKGVKANKSSCHKCGKMGHFAKQCRPKKMHAQSVQNPMYSAEGDSQNISSTVMNMHTVKHRYDKPIQLEFACMLDS